MTDTTFPATADWDGAWKEALGNLLRQFLAMFFPRAHGEVDWSRPPEALDKELQKIAPQSAAGPRAVDLLFKVWLLSGEERWVLLHLEVQAQREADFPERVFDYYPMVKLLDWAERVGELEASDNPFAVVVLAHLKARETAGDRPRRRAWKVRLLKGLYGRGWERKDVHELIKLIDWFLALPRNDDRMVREEIEADEKEKQMPYVTSFEKMAEERGEARGEARGRAEGEARGRSAVLKDAIALALRLKFGPAGQQLASEVQAIGDLETLMRVFDSIEAAATVEDVRRASAT